MYKEVWDKPKGAPYQYKDADYDLYEDSEEEVTIWLDPSEDPAKDPTDWIRNFMAIPVKVNIGGMNLLVHQGFYIAFKELIEDLLPRIEKYKYVNINGCSHGAATGQLLTLYLKAETNKIVTQAVFFGAPKVFFIVNPLKYLKLSKILRDVICVRLGHDVVHLLPLFPYVHIGSVERIKYNKNKFPQSLIKDHGDYGRYYNES